MTVHRLIQAYDPLIIQLSLQAHYNSSYDRSMHQVLLFLPMVIMGAMSLAFSNHCHESHYESIFFVLLSALLLAGLLGCCVCTVGYS